MWKIAKIPERISPLVVGKCGNLWGLGGGLAWLAVRYGRCSPPGLVVHSSSDPLPPHPAGTPQGPPARRPTPARTAPPRTRHPAPCEVRRWGHRGGGRRSLEGANTAHGSSWPMTCIPPVDQHKASVHSTRGYGGSCPLSGHRRRRRRRDRHPGAPAH